MLKRWAGARWLVGGIATVVVALAIAWVLFVPGADWLAHHDVASAKGPLLQTARDAARGRLLTLAAGLLAISALVYTARNFTLSREGQVTDRYTKAIEQLGSDKLDVRIGGIYALERVARDSARDHPTVMEVLAAFIREHSHEQWPPSDPGGRVRTPSPRPVGRRERARRSPRTDLGRRERAPRPDVQAALTVVGRRDAKRDIKQVNLAGADLVGADLTSATLTRADLTDADLTDADLFAADLTGADLTSATLTRADLTDADLTSAWWPEDTPVPVGWKLGTISGRLGRAGTGSGPTEAI